MTPTTEAMACDASNEPIEVKIIAAASDGFVRVTPEKCERIRKLLDSHAALALAGALEQLCEHLTAKSFPLTPHDTAEACITLCDLQDEARTLASSALAALAAHDEKVRLEEAMKY